MNDEIRKERERFVARNSLENLLGDIDFGKYDGSEGKSYFEETLMKNFKIVMSYLTKKNLTSEDKNSLKEDVKQLIESREMVIKGEGGNKEVLVNIKIPGSNNHNLCLQFDIGGVSQEISPATHQLMDIFAPEVKDTSGNIPAAMVWIAFLDENKVVDQNSGSIYDRFIVKLDDIVPSYHPKMREEIPDYFFDN